MKKILLSKTKLLFFLSFVFSSFLFGQTTLVNYQFNNNLNPSVAGPSVTTLEYYTGSPKAPGTPNYNGGWLRVPQSRNGDYLELTTNTTGIQNMALSFDARLSALGLTGHWIVEANIGTSNAFVEIGRIDLFSILWIPFNNNLNINLPTTAENRTDLKIKLKTSFSGSALGNLDIDNLKITYGNPKIQVYTNGNNTVTPNVPADVHVPHLSAAAVNLDTDFGTRMTTDPSISHRFRVRNLNGTSGSKLKIDSIVVKGANPLDFSVNPTTLSDIGVSGSSTSNLYKTFDILFHPTADGLRTAQIYLYSNAYGSDSANPYIINVLGTGASCNLQTTIFANNNMTFGVQQSLPGDYGSGDIVGGTAKSNSLGIRLYPSGWRYDPELYISSPTSWYVQNASKTIEFGPLDVSEQKNVQIRFRVAGFGTANNKGPNQSSFVTLEVQKPDTTWSKELKLQGSDDSDGLNYDYEGGDNLSGTYDGDDTPNQDYNGSHGWFQPNPRYKQFILNIPASANIQNLKFRITANTNADNRLWLIDDVEVLTSNSVYKTFTTANVWSPSAPTANEKAVIEGDYTNAGNQNICECEVMPGGKVTIPANTSITVRGKVINNAVPENFIVKHDGNLRQIEDDAINTGAITVEKTFNFSTDRKQYNYIISPVVGQAIKTIYPNAPFVIYHKEDKNFFYNAGNGAYDVNNPAKGFAIKEGAGSGVTSQTGTFKGTPFNGVAKYVVKYTPNPSDPTFTPGYNLIGNPYPSNLDIEAFYDDNADKIESTFEFWDNRGNTIYQQQGSGYGGSNYAKYNAVNGTGIGSGTATGATPVRKPNRYIKVGTAFMVRALSTANGDTLVYKNAYRSVDNSGPGFFGKGQQQKDRYWLTLDTPGDLSLMTAVVYFDKGNNAFGMDDSPFADASDDIYTMADDHALAIQGRAPFTDTDVVPLGINAFKTGEYKISLYKAEGIFDANQKIYLKDNLTQTITNLSEGDYTFTTEPGIIEGRFTLIYKTENSTLNVNDVDKADLLVYRNAGDFVIQSKSKNIDYVEVYDLSGRLQQKRKTTGKEVLIHANEFTEGIYILRIIRQGEVSTKKIRK